MVCCRIRQSRQGCIISLEMTQKDETERAKLTFYKFLSSVIEVGSCWSPFTITLTDLAFRSAELTDYIPLRVQNSRFLY